MARHSFKFGKWISRHDVDPHIEGPRFHRWLPDGEHDALQLETDDPNASLRVWFRRFGKMDGGFIQFAFKETSFDPAAIPRQAALEGGPLYGQLDLEIDDADVANLKTASPEGERVAKRILRLIQAPTSRLLRILRTHYGQYWLDSWEEWDSRKSSLQAALSAISLDWKNPGTGEWEKVVVGENVLDFTLAVAPKDLFDHCLTAADWQDLQKLANSKGVEVTPAAVQLVLAHEALDRGDVRLALIEGVTACELVVNECLRRPEDDLAKAVQSFWNLPLGAQLVAVSTARRADIDSVDLTSALKAIEFRNKVVHEGWRPRPAREIVIALEGLRRTLGKLLSPPPFKFATADARNFVMPESDWAKHN